MYLTPTILNEDHISTLQKHEQNLPPIMYESKDTGGLMRMNWSPIQYGSLKQNSRNTYYDRALRSNQLNFENPSTLALDDNFNDNFNFGLSKTKSTKKLFDACGNFITKSSLPCGLSLSDSSDKWSHNELWSKPKESFTPTNFSYPCDETQITQIQIEKEFDWNNPAPDFFTNEETTLNTDTDTNGIGLNFSTF